MQTTPMNGDDPKIEPATAPETFAEIIVAMNVEFDDRTLARHAMGAETYGPGKFLLVDTMEEALDEICDLANYARYTFIKMRLLQEQIQQAMADTPESTEFMSAADFMKGRQ
jgi:hypothetical protein